MSDPRLCKLMCGPFDGEFFMNIEDIRAGLRVAESPPRLAYWAAENGQPRQVRHGRYAAIFNSKGQPVCDDDGVVPMIYGVD